MILNKKKAPGRVRVKTIDAEAKAGHDYETYDRVISFNSGSTREFVDIKIIDDDNWEPDKDFFIQLFNADNND